MIGIGVTTRNRRSLAKKCITHILKNTVSPFNLVVVDDDSEVPYIDKRCNVVRNSPRKGIASSKNICLRELSGSSHIFLFDDDCWPTVKGWEQKYIEASQLSGCQLMCYTWDTMTDGSKNPHCEITETLVQKEKIQLTVGGKRFLIDEEKASRVHQYKMEIGYGYGWNHAIEREIDVALKVHKNGLGAMMYMTKQCVDRLGGFCEEFPMYGGEHLDYFTRGYNAGLSPGKYVDVSGSEKLFYAMDRKPVSEREKASTAEMDGNLDTSSDLLEIRKNSSERANI